MRRILDAARAAVVRLRTDGGWVLLAALGLWLVVAAPLVTGARTLVLRDVMTTHLPWKAFGAQELAQLRIPATNPGWALGHPFRGDPNALPFYPGNLLYLALPFWAAFGTHFAGHWLLAFCGMRRLARELGQSREAAVVAALAYGGGGFVLSTLSFMNLLTVAAWAPWTLAGLARGDRRGTWLAGLACGLMLLGGEPVSAALVIPAMGLAAATRRSAASACVAAAAAGAIGLLVALPQLVATARIWSFSVRATIGLPATQAAAQALHPGRLLELVWPLPWGWPSDLGRLGYWAPAITPQTPYVYTLHFGLVAAGLLLFGWRRQRRWAALAAAALVAAWSLGLDAGVTATLTGGLARYPQKLLLPFALAVAIVAGAGLEGALARTRPARPWIAGAGLFASIGLAITWGRAPFAEWLRVHLVNGGHAGLAQTQVAHWALLAFVAAALAAGAAWATARRSPTGLAAVQLIALLPLAPLWVTDSTAPYRAAPALAGAIDAPRRVAHAAVTSPPWEPPAAMPSAAANPVTQARWARQALEPPFGPFDGLEHVTAPDLDGLASPLVALLHRELAAADWPTRMRWLRRLGAGWLLRDSPAPGPDASPLATLDRPGGRVELDRIEPARPWIDWPAAYAVASSPVEAWRLGARLEATTAIASREVAHDPEGRAWLVSAAGDRVEIDVESNGGWLVVRRAYLPLIRARLTDGTRLATQPVELALLGVEVPAGRHRVVIDVASWPEAIAGIVALAAAAAIGWLSWRRA